MAYTKELEFITSHIREAYTVYALAGPQDVRQKSAFDLVTEVDVAIEQFLTQVPCRGAEQLPGDHRPHLGH